MQAYAKGFYIGAGVGGDITNFDKKLYIQNASQQTIYDKNDNLAGQGIFGGGVIGYQWTFANQFNLALELNGSLSSLRYHGAYEDNSLAETSSGTFTLNRSFGVSFLPGYAVVPRAILYARLGVVRGRFNYQETKLFANQSAEVNQTEWLNGYIYGLGVETAMTENISLRVEYDRINYQTYTNQTFPMPSGQKRTIKLTPFANQMNLELLYRFS